jgi:hypothetical protein
LINQVRSHLRRRQQDPATIRRFFHAPSVVYAAA